MSKQLYIYTFFIIILLSMSCEKAFDWDYENNAKDLIVVEGIITNEVTFQRIKLTHPTAVPHDENVPIINAQLIVSIGNIHYPFTQDTAVQGLYISDVAFSANTNQATLLSISYNNKTYIAQDKMIQISPMLRAHFDKVNNNSDWYVINPYYGFYSSEQAMWEITADWSFLPEFTNTPIDSCKARLYFFSLHNIDVSQIFAPEKQKVWVHKGAQITQKKYALSSQHAQFWRSLLLETEWRGGLFDVSQGEIYTNLSDGAVGFFGASMVLKDTYFLN